MGRETQKLRRYATRSERKASLPRAKSWQSAVTGPATSQKQPASADARLRKADVLAVLKRQLYRCALTGRTLQPEVANIDHIVPLAKGGQHVPANIQILHEQVNQAKNSMTQAEFIALCREVVAFIDSKA